MNLIKCLIFSLCTIMLGYTTTQRVINQVTPDTPPKEAIVVGRALLDNPSGIPGSGLTTTGGAAALPSIVVQNIETQEKFVIDNTSFAVFVAARKEIVFMLTVPPGKYEIVRTSWRTYNRFEAPNRFDAQVGKINYIGDIEFTIKKYNRSAFRAVHHIYSDLDAVTPHIEKHLPNIDWPIIKSMIY